MSLRGVGVDLCDIARIETMLTRWGDSLRGRMFEEREWDDVRGRAQSLAARWAAKEAFAKAIGSGFRGFAWVDVAVHRDERGQPGLVLTGNAQRLVRKAGGGRFFLSFSHESGMAVAVVAWDA